MDEDADKGKGAVGREIASAASGLGIRHTWVYSQLMDTI